MKSPSPDGFNAFFFKHSWVVVNVDVIEAIREFFDNNAMLDS